METDEYLEVSSPPLWKKNSSPSHPLLRRHSHRRSLSSKSRAEAIARGQWELMEMVKTMPESSYELSLKDLVEHHYRVENHHPVPQTADQPVKVVVVKREKIKIDGGNNSMSGGGRSFQNKGLFINMVFPFSLKPKKRKKAGGANNGGGSKGGGGGGGKYVLTGCWPALFPLRKK
ncbi:hypothetical protein ACP275_03G099000 [Erythranthe tilingii]